MLEDFYCFSSVLCGSLQLSLSWVFLDTFRYHVFVTHEESPGLLAGPDHAVADLCPCTSIHSTGNVLLCTVIKW